MPFPPAHRVIYKKNPLVEVICQFRFPPILSIETEVPAKLQEAIRNMYPLFTENAEILFTIPNVSNNVDAAVAQKLEFPPSSINRKNYEFRSADENWKINLTRDFLALSTTHYHRWEEFSAQLDQAFHAFIEIYSPAYFSRIGLRYRDIINRSVLSLEGANWSDLLKPYVLGILNDPAITANVIATTNITEIRLSDNQSVVRI
ncbi:MAG: TIGR04255 family protein, partial [Anaerolineales bacterium]